MADETLRTCLVEIVVPVHNEERILEHSIRRLHAFLTAGVPFDFRITIAENASTDTTLEMARSLAAEQGCIEVVHTEAKGRGGALRQVWSRSDADFVAYMDADLSTGLDALVPLIAPLILGECDLAVGSRLLSASRIKRSLGREVISRGYNGIVRLAFRSRFSDAQCGFKAGRSDVIRELLLGVDDDDWFFDTELLMLAERNHLRIHEVPVEWIEDSDSRVVLMPTILAQLRGLARVGSERLRGRRCRM